ncbi:ead/Ea22-like family protein [Klebsiella sp. RHBSTW-00215]|uniref:ead/Ea22-like family protein n=1 Tax=Klebsiella sp. RHBSTW-00215 TaxID=2742640 RepID=UPI001E57C617|nr:ead/Ea22-like family protein [Klebsiella sp. RHBSTW-00215]
MSEFNIEDLDAVIARSREGSLAQMLALQLKGQIRKSEQLSAENVAAKKIISECREYFIAGVMNRIRPTNEGYLHMICDTFADETPATDHIVAGIKADGRVEGAHFVANRMLAAWDAGFIEDTAKNAADIARMILTSTEFMADAPEGDFDRSFADGILEDIAQQMREGAK